MRLCSCASGSGARLALVLGDDELERGAAALKPLRQEGVQTEVPLAELATRLPGMLEPL